jgi:hypothetical protein
MSGQSAHGKKHKILINGNDVSIYFKQVDMSGTADVLDSTCFDMTAKQFVVGQRDGKATGNGIWAAKDLVGDPDEIDEILSALQGVDADQIVTIGQAGLSSVGLSASLLKAKQMKYGVSSPNNNLVSITLELQTSLGIRTGIVHAALAARTATGTGVSQDGAAASANGAHVHLHCTVKSGTAAPSLTVIVEDSADNAAWSTIGTFAALTAVGALRLELAGTVRRYTRISWAITGTTPSFTFAAALARL